MTTMDHLTDRHLLVLGLGDSGLAMVRWCVAGGATVRVWDSREQPPQAATLRAELPQVQLSSGPLQPAEALQGVELVLKSPGLSPLDERIRPLLDALARSAPLVGPEPGDGQKVKLVNQLLCGVHIAAAAEGLAFAEALGLDARACWEVLRDGAADGSLRAVDDPDETATVLYNMVGWTYQHLRRGHGWSGPRASRAVIELAVSGLEP